MQPQISINIGKLRLRNPVMVSSGTFGYAEEFKDFVNLKKLGYNAMAHLLIKAANRSKTPEILDKMLQIPNLITTLEFVGGEYDLFPIIVVRDYEELFKLKEQINTIQGIEQSDIILAEPYYAWPLNLFASLL